MGRWLPNTAMKLKSGQGLFAGVPSTSGSSTISFSVVEDANSTKFESTSYNTNTWYLLGFGYDITVGTIKIKYPNSVVFTMENDAYKKIDDNTTTIPKAKDFGLNIKIRTAVFNLS